MQKAHCLALGMILGWSGSVYSAALSVSELARMRETKRVSQRDSASTSLSSGVAAMGRDRHLELWPLCQKQEIYFADATIIGCHPYADGFGILASHPLGLSFWHIDRLGNLHCKLKIPREDLLRKVPEAEGDYRYYRRHMFLFLNIIPCGLLDLKQDWKIMRFTIDRRGEKKYFLDICDFGEMMQPVDSKKRTIMWSVSPKERRTKFAFSGGEKYYNWELKYFLQATKWKRFFAKNCDLTWYDFCRADNCVLFYGEISDRGNLKKQHLRVLLDATGHPLWVMYGELKAVPDHINADGTLMMRVTDEGKKIILWIHDNKQSVHHPELLHDLKLFLYNCTLGYSSKKAWLANSSPDLIPLTADEQKRLNEYVAKVRPEGYQSEEEDYDVCGF